MPLRHGFGFASLGRFGLAFECFLALAQDFLAALFAPAHRYARLPTLPRLEAERNGNKSVCPLYGPEVKVTQPYCPLASRLLNVAFT